MGYTRMKIAVSDRDAGVLARWLAACLLAVALTGCGGDGGGGTLVSPDQPAVTGGETTEQPGAWPAGLPGDGVQPWEELDGAGRVVASATGDAGFKAGYQCFTNGSAGVSEEGDTLRLDSAADGTGGLAWACYRLPLAGVQPGLVSIDANVRPGGPGVAAEYYIGLSNYARGTWDWSGPFSDNEVLLSTGAAAASGTDFLSGYGNTFVCVVTCHGACADIVGVAAQPRDAVDVTAPAAPTGLSATTVAGGLELQWNRLRDADLAGYRVYYSAQPILDTTGRGVKAVDRLIAGERYLLDGLTGLTYVRIAAVDLSGNESPLGETVAATPLAQDAGAVSLTVDIASAMILDPVVLTAGGADEYMWDLDGDGVYDVSGDTTGVQTAQTNRSGIIRPRVRGTSGGGACVACGGVSLLISSNARPAASGTANPAAGIAPLIVNFAGADSRDFDGQLVNAGWDYDGDGVYDNWGPVTGGVVDPAQYEYTAAGVYNARLKVEDDQGAWDADTCTIIVNPAPGPANIAPVADLVCDPSGGSAPLTVNLRGDGSADSDGTIVEYAFDTDGDGLLDTFSETLDTVQHTFTAPGSYWLRLRVTDDDGAMHTVSGGVNVTASGGTAPVADLVVDPVYCNQGDLVELDGSGSYDDSTIELFEWDFDGDGCYDAYGTGAVLDHQFNDPGIYSVGLRVTDDAGAQATASASLRVNETFDSQHIWGRYGNDPRNTHRTPYLGPQAGSVAWTITTGSYIPSSPSIGADGTIYFGSMDDYLYAADPSGNVLWRFYANDDVISSPALGPDGTIYIGSKNDQIYAINPDGSLKWSYATGGDIIGSAALSPGGVIYIGSLDGKLYALNPDGTLRWSYDTGDQVGGCPALAVDGTIYFGSGDDFFALNPDGSLKWSYAMSFSSLPPTIDVDGRIIVNSPNHHLYSFTPEGNRVLYYDAGGSINMSPALNWDGTFYGCDHNDYNFFAMDRGGGIKWTVTMPGSVVSTPAIDPDGIIYFGCRDSNFYAYYPDGTEKWSCPMGGYVSSSSPAISADGMIYIGAYDNKLYAIGESVGNTAPVADLAVDRTTSYAPFLINFDASGSTDTDGEIVLYEWDFDGDGTFDESGPSPFTSWTYPERGWYTAEVQVTDEDGDVDSTTMDITLPSEWSSHGGTIKSRQPQFYSGPTSNATDWTFSTPADSLLGEAVIDPLGNIYFGSADNKLYCVSNTGSQLWSHTAPDDVNGVALASNGLIYNGCADGFLYAQNLDGTTIWSYNLGAEAHTPTIGPDGCIYIGDMGGIARAFNPDGSVKWTVDTGYPINSPITVDDDGMAYVPMAQYSHQLMAINPDGTEKWEHGYYNGIVDSRPLVLDDYIYLADDGSRLHCIMKETGVARTNWPKYIDYKDGCNTSFGIDPAGYFYFGDDSGLIYKFEFDGSQISSFSNWPYDTGNDVNCTPLVDASGNVFVGNDSGSVLALDSEANQLWLYNAGSAVVFLILDHHGALYAGCANGDLVKIIQN